MKTRSILAILALATTTAAYADYDAKAEAQEKAQREAAAKAAAAQKADLERQKSASEQKMMRGMLGKEAEGKSNAEVKVLYDKKMGGYMDQAKKAQADAQMKGMTGKSMQDIQKMSPAEQEAFSKQMEKQYGGAAK